MLVETHRSGERHLSDRTGHRQTQGTGPCPRGPGDVDQGGPRFAIRSAPGGVTLQPPWGAPAPPPLPVSSSEGQTEPGSRPATRQLLRRSLSKCLFPSADAGLSGRTSSTFTRKLPKRGLVGTCQHYWKQARSHRRESSRNRQLRGPHVSWLPSGHLQPRPPAHRPHRQGASTGAEPPGAPWTAVSSSACTPVEGPARGVSSRRGYV